MKYAVKMNDKTFEVEVDRVSPFHQMTREEIAAAAGVSAAPAPAAPASAPAAPAPAAAPAAPVQANPMPAGGIPMPVPIGQTAPVAITPLGR